MNMQLQRSYLQSLDQPAVENVFRHLSDFPNHPKGSLFIASGVLMSSLCLGQCFDEIARAVLTRVDVNGNRALNGDCIVPFSALHDVFHAVKGQLKAFFIERSHSTNEQTSFPWLQALASNRAALHTVEMDGATNLPLEKAVLSAIRGRVERLAISGMQAELVGTHFVGLRELRLQ